MGNKSFYKELTDSNKYIIKSTFFIFFVNGIFAMVFGSMLPLLSDTYKLSNTVSGFLLSSHQVGNLIAAFVAGILPIYLGRKKSILFLTSFVIVGFTLIIITGQPALLILAFLFTGIGRGGISNFNNKVVNDISNSSPTASNLLHSMFSIGALLSPFIIIMTTKQFGENGWRVTSLIIIALIVVSQIMFARMSIEENTIENSKTKNVMRYDFLKDKLFWITASILFFYLSVEATITGFVVTYFVDTDILTVFQSQTLLSVLWIGILIGRLSVVFFGGRLKKEKLLLIISIGTAIFYILLLNTATYSLISVIMLGLGVSMGGIYPTALTIAGDSIEKYPMAMGWLLILGSIGGIVMPVITGTLGSYFGIFAGMSAIVIAIFLMLGAITTYMIYEKNNK